MHENVCNYFMLRNEPGFAVFCIFNFLCTLYGNNDYQIGTCSEKFVAQTINDTFSKIIMPLKMIVFKIILI